MTTPPPAPALLEIPTPPPAGGVDPNLYLPPLQLLADGTRQRSWGWLGPPNPYPPGSYALAGHVIDGFTVSANSGGGGITVLLGPAVQDPTKRIIDLFPEAPPDTPDGPLAVPLIIRPRVPEQRPTPPPAAPPRPLTPPRPGPVPFTPRLSAARLIESTISLVATGPNPGRWVQTVTGPLFLADALPQWVVELAIEQAGGLSPGEAPPGVAPAAATVPGAGILTGTLVTPPEGIALNADWTALGTALRAPREGYDPTTFTALIALMRERGAELGFTDPGEWNGLLNVLSAIGDGIDRTGLNSTPWAVDLFRSSVDGIASGAGHATAGLTAGAGAFADLIASIKDLDPKARVRELSDRLSATFTDLHETLLTTLDTDNPGDFNAAAARAMDALKIALGAGFAAHAGAVALELLHPFKTLGFAQILAPVADLAAFGPLTNALWVRALDAAVTRPLRHSYNARWPTDILGVRDVRDLAEQHEYDTAPIDAATGTPQPFADALAHHGLPPSTVTALWQHAWTPMRSFEVVRFADTLLATGPPDAALIPRLLHYGTDPADPLWWLDLNLRRAGQPPWMIDALKRAVVHRATKSDREAYELELQRHVRKGYALDAGYRDRARALGDRDEVIDLHLATAQLAQAADFFDGLTATWEQQYIREQITIDDLRVNLSTQVIDPNAINMRVAVAQAKHDLRLRERGTTATDHEHARVQAELVRAYRTQYRGGQINDLALLEALLSAGLSEPLANATVYADAVALAAHTRIATTSAEDREQARVRTALEGAYLDQYRAGLIDEEQLRAALVAAGQSDALAAATVARAWSQLVRAASSREDAAGQREAVILERDYINHQRALFRAGATTVDELQAALTDAGLTLARARAIVQEELDRGAVASVKRSAATRPAPTAPRA